MKKLLTLLFLTSQVALCQIGLQDQYQFNMLAINPAFTGERGNFGVSGLLGQQFNGTIQPNQVSQLISMDGKLNNERNSIGFQGFRSAVTGFTNNGMALTYSYSFQASADLKVNVGINAGFMVSPNFVGNVDVLQRFNPFGGPGVAAFVKDGFLSVAAPTLFSKANTYTTINKDIKLAAGYRIGNYENVALNFMILSSLATNASSQNGFDVNAKIWLGNKIGLGGSFRTQSGKNKIIPNFQIRVSESSTLGLSYDDEPLIFLNTNPGFRNSNGIFQLMYRYDVFNSGYKSPFINQF